MAFHPCPESYIGSVSLMRRLVASYRLGGSAREYQSNPPGSFPATHVFQGMVSAEDVRHGKPEPEVYLLAAARIGVPPERCVVVEDAVAGIEGARRAGMKSVGVNRNGAHLPADVVFQSLELLDPNTFEMLTEGGPANAK